MVTLGLGEFKATHTWLYSWEVADLGWEQGAGEQKGDSFLMNYVIHANEWAGTSAAVK